MWIVISIIYLLVGLVIGSGICIHLGDDPNEPDNLGAIFIIGIIWPAVLVYVLVIFLTRFIANVTKKLYEYCTNDWQEKEESHG